MTKNSVFYFYERRGGGVYDFEKIRNEKEKKEEEEEEKKGKIYIYIYIYIDV